ncbi:uncharacterized protein PHALS_04543 [Plasmopara halstedii]|uniref:CRN-like protein n=1 Tax=Plasmopara halstedii TaxID=4781 RepID=A0A0N7L3X4_PLAHL|nr:uncharacterized protein PHALS_04543 [Plasmopara halstedii]CEG37083.1 hypothetical protein PHALS_04543 [Plasmopara halstedii]|eukprot:XP_024573452.1 hypothetical protein PHALS_04543 [Plasmopara halstedii]
MDEVELECAVYGREVVFSEKITRDTKVEALQKAIFDDQRYKGRFSFPASALTRDMRPSWALNDKKYFGKKKPFKPGYKEMYILVELIKVAGVARGEREWSAEDLSTLETSSMSMEEDPSSDLRVAFVDAVPLPSTSRFFKVTAPQDIQLIRCRMAVEVYPTMHVLVSGFPGALEARGFNHPYAIVPALVTGWKCFFLLCLLQVPLEMRLYARKGGFQLDILAVGSTAPRITSSFSRLAWDPA